MRSSPRAAPLLAFLLALPAGAGAQQASPPGSIQRSVEVRVTSLDVVVTDRRGTRVTGLTAADFEVREDGAVQTITNFSEVGAIGRAASPVPAPGPAGSEPAPPDRAAAPEAPAPARPETSLVLFVDNLHLSVPNRNRALADVRGLLRRSAEAGVPVLVVSSERSPKIRQRFTTDVALLDRAVDDLLKESALGAMAEASRRATFQGIDQAMRDRKPQVAEALARTYAESTKLDLYTSLEALERTIAQLAALEGRKVLVHVSDGLQQAPGGDAFAFLRSFSGGGRGIGPGTVPGADDSAERYSRLTRSAAAARVALHTVDATGLSEETLTGADTQFRSTGRIEPFATRMNLQSMLAHLADETGGTAVLNRNQLAEPLAEVEDDLSSYYSIGYESPRADEDATHAVEVRVKRPGLRARSQRSLRVKSADSRVAEGVAAALFFGREENPFGVTVESGEPRHEGKRVLFPIRVRVPATRLVLLPEGTGSRGSAVFYFQVRDQEGRLSDLVRQELSLRDDGEVVHEATLEMRRGRQVLSLAVRDGTSGIASYVQKTVVIPDVKK